MDNSCVKKKQDRICDITARRTMSILGFILCQTLIFSYFTKKIIIAKFGIVLQKTVIFDRKHFLIFIYVLFLAFI